MWRCPSGGDSSTSETSVQLYETTQRNIVEENHVHPPPRKPEILIYNVTH